MTKTVFIFYWISLIIPMYITVYYHQLDPFSFFLQKPNFRLYKRYIFDDT